MSARVTSAGYLPCNCSWSVGENLAWGKGKHGTPAAIVAAWMASPGHREMILTGEHEGGRHRGSLRQARRSQRLGGDLHRRLRLPELTPMAASAARLVVLTVLGLLAGSHGGWHASASAPSFSPPPVNAGFDYQIGGDYPLPEGVSVVSRDWFSGRAADEPAYSICYVNAFQTQADEPGADRPDERSNWPRRLVLERARRRSELGRRVPGRHQHRRRSAGGRPLGSTR